MKTQIIKTCGMLLIAAAALTQQAFAQGGTWTSTGSMVAARYNHTATLFPNGKVLVAGGYNGPGLSSAELYDPVTGIWTATGSMTALREEHVATLLPNGKVLVAGGYTGFTGGEQSSAELYNPTTGTWAA